MKFSEFLKDTTVVTQQKHVLQRFNDFILFQISVLHDKKFPLQLDWWTFISLIFFFCAYFSSFFEFLKGTFSLPPTQTHQHLVNKINVQIHHTNHIKSQQNFSWLYKLFSPKVCIWLCGRRGDIEIWGSPGDIFQRWWKFPQQLRLN